MNNKTINQSPTLERWGIFAIVSAMTPPSSAKSSNTCAAGTRPRNHRTTPPWRANTTIPLTYHPLPDSAGALGQSGFDAAADGGTALFIRI